MPVKAKKADPHAPRREKDGSVTFFLYVASCSPDAVQYKPYQTTLIPVGTLLVSVNVPAAEVVAITDTAVHLTAKGWFLATRQIAMGSVSAFAAK